MGDHSKTGINTMLNTGTTVGVSSNIFGAAFPPKFIPSFSWGGADGFSEFKKDKAFEVSVKMIDAQKFGVFRLGKGHFKPYFQGNGEIPDIIACFLHMAQALTLAYIH